MLQILSQEQRDEDGMPTHLRPGRVPRYTANWIKVYCPRCGMVDEFVGTKEFSTGQWVVLADRYHQPWCLGR